MGAADYSTRGAAVRAAKAAAKRRFGPAYEAYEGPDFYVERFLPWGQVRHRFRFKALWAAA